MQDSELDNYIAAIVRKAQEDQDSDRPLTRKEMEELALSMGLTEEQFRELMVKAIRHTQTARRFLDQNNYEDGLKEAKNAVAINPYVEKGYSMLALAYFQKYQDLGDYNDRVQAEYAAQKALKLNSHDQRAINVMSALSKDKRTKSKDNKRIYIVLAALIMAIAIGAVVFIALGKQIDDAMDQQDQNSTKNQLIEAEETVNSIEMEIKVEQDRKRSLIREFIAIGPESSHAQTKLKKKLSFLVADGIDPSELDEAFKEYKSTFPAELDESIQTHLIQIEGAENRIAFQRGELAKAIKAYNILVKKYGSENPEFQLKEYSYE
ncbi:MAG: hypothetical protein KDC84_10250 [Crocinitomicaceae bacterium]|nr:hypothetical protein [Crocinitomicaceae bacterium]